VGVLFRSEEALRRASEVYCSQKALLSRLVEQIIRVHIHVQVHLPRGIYLEFERVCDAEDHLLLVVEHFLYY
jgi:hypothetical protein